MPKIRIDKRDTIFSKLIRTRDKWTCQRCGRKYEEGSQGLHCSHFFSRRHRGTRWSVENAAAHCMGCHAYLGGNPIEFAEWIEAYLGRDRFSQLRMKAMKVTKFTKADLEWIYQDLKAQLKELENAY